MQEVERERESAWCESVIERNCSGHKVKKEHRVKGYDNLASEVQAQPIKISIDPYYFDALLHARDDEVRAVC